MMQALKSLKLTHLAKVSETVGKSGNEGNWTLLTEECALKNELGSREPRLLALATEESIMRSLLGPRDMFFRMAGVASLVRVFNNAAAALGVPG